LRTSFVVPCYQEEASLERFGPHLAEVPADEILFVDDGSTDGTAAALRAIAERDARVRVLTHPGNRGVGAAMRTGIEASTGDVVVVYDADRTYPLEDATRLIDALVPDRGVATASPFGAGGAVEGVSRGRRFLSRAATFCYRLALGRRARGVGVFTCAFRAYRGDLARSLVWKSDGFPATAEMLGDALLRGALVSTVASRLRARSEGDSKLRVVPTTLGHFGVLWRLWWRRWLR
jgi:glycosyltransferase involved in cell wall biosynthesis